MRCLVTGASGYVGGRLVPRLLAEGYEVRCLTRSAGRLRDEPWFGQVEAATGDVTSGAGLAEALDGVEVAYYLIHAMGQPDFERIDRDGANNFARTAAAARVRRLVYLGGPDPTETGTPGAAVSPHLRSRAEVAKILLRGEVPTTVLRAAMIIGSGSASFEMMRYLTERLPVMVTPRWVSNRIEPIAIRDVLRYLVASAAPDTYPTEVSRAFDIGGGEVLTYGEMMRRYAVIARLGPRLIIPVRPLTPGLSSLWVGLVTPVPNSIARPLVESLIHEAVTHEHDIAAHIPDPPDGLTDFDTSVALALRRVRAVDVPDSVRRPAWQSRGRIPGAATDSIKTPARRPRGRILGAVETPWSDASWPGAPSEPLPADPLPSDPSWSGGTVYTDVRRVAVHAPPERLWQVVESIGGEQGWYSFPLAWAVRGWLDRLIGGVGLSRGRRDPHHLSEGDTLDFWRVEQIVPGSLLRLRAEMRVPGRAWLEMRVVPDGDGMSTYSQRAIFLPRGLPGRTYWAAILPFHALVFGGMARNIAATAESHRA
jgi:uncharacterized protein YbjT (DUF2867 family)